VDDSYSLVDAAKEHRVHTKWGHVAFYEGDGKIARLAASPSGATMLTIAVRRRGENRGRVSGVAHLDGDRRNGAASAGRQVG